MAKKIYGLSAADKKLVKETIARSVGGFKRRRPTNKRRRFSGGGKSQSGEVRAAILIAKVDAATITMSAEGSTVTPGTSKGGSNDGAAAYVLDTTWKVVDTDVGEHNGLIDIENYKLNELRGSNGDPRIVVGMLYGTTLYVVPNDMGTQPKWDKTKNQLFAHDNDTESEWQEPGTCAGA